MKKKKRFEDYKFQVINHTDKIITYTDDKSKHLMTIGKTTEIFPIEFRKKITVEFSGFKIKSE